MDTRELIRKVRKIEIKTRKIVEDIAGGAYHSMFKGRGIEFSEVRAYSVEDDVRDIDWNVTARMGAPYIKKYVEERELTVMLAVDISRSCFFGSGASGKQEQMAEVAALLAFSAIRNNDKVGLLLFSGRTEFYLPPRSGRQHVLRLIRELVARETTDSSSTNLNVPMEYLSRSLKKRSVVFLISDFVDCDDFERTLKLLNRKHDTAAIRIRDNAEARLPFTAGVQFADAETEEAITGSCSPDDYAKIQQDLREYQNKLFRRTMTDYVDLQCGQDIVKPLLRFFGSRSGRRGA